MQNELLDGFMLRDKRIEPLTGTISGPGGNVHLPSKAIEVLLCLARTPRRLVNRESILESVWGSADASQESLHHTISDIRQALGDRADRPLYIQTVPKRGYRLLVVPEVTRSTTDGGISSARTGLIAKLMDRGVIQAAAAFLVVGWLMIQVADAVTPTLGLPGWVSPFVTYVVIVGFPLVVLMAWFLEFAEGHWYLDSGKESPASGTGLERNYLTIFLAYALSAAGGLVYQYSVGFEVPQGLTPAPPEVVRSDIDVDPNSIAVLRFMNIDGSDETEIFSQGLAEDVLDRLARVRGLRVSSRGDSWSLPVNSSSDIVRRRLRVAYFLEGSVRLVGDELRVVAQLIDSDNGFHVISRSFDRKLEDFMQVQDEITNLTVANLRVALPEATQLQLTSEIERTTVDAYVLYRQGREAMHRPSTPATIAEATNYYERALRADPGYAAAYAGLCDAHTRAFELSSDDESIQEAERACAAALAENSNLHMVYAALGYLYLQTGRYADAENAFVQAIDINDQDVSAMQGLADIYERQHRLDDAIDLLNRAIRQQPGNWRSIDTLGTLFFANGRFAEAADAYRRVSFLDPGNDQGHGNLGSALLMLGDFAAAEDALHEALEIEPSLTYLSNLAIIYYYQGRFAESVSIHLLATEEAPELSYVWLNLADAQVFAGETAAAQAAFGRAAELASAVLTVNPRDSAVMYELAWATAMRGDTEQARQLIARSLSMDPNDPYVHYYDALLKNRTGLSDEAVVALQEAVRLGYPKVLLAAEPYLEALRVHAGFYALLDGNEL